jgi:hypothetical protein
VVTATVGGTVDADASGRVKPQPAIAMAATAISAHADAPLRRMVTLLKTYQYTETFQAA